MPHAIERWACTVCGSEYAKRLAAERCENSPVPPCPTAPNREIKLKNRDGKTYTVTRVVNVFLVNRLRMHMSGFGETTPEDVLSGDEEMLKRFYPVHTWMAEVDPHVFLDHKWEDYVNEVELDVYLVSEEAASGMTRKDNDHGG